MKRDPMLARLSGRECWDLLVIGGGATGLGIAVDAAARGYQVLLAERGDFAQGTSSRSTKLIHGGVRYLQQGRLGLVREALLERSRLYRNAPHLVRDLPFVVPAYAWWELPFYGAGLKLYDRLAASHGFAASCHLGREAVAARLPNLRHDGLRGGILYHDGQFDDARLAVALARTAADHGATLINYCEAIALIRAGQGEIDGAVLLDRESGREHTVSARAVVNAAGPFCDAVRRLAQPQAAPLLAPSRGIHLVLDAGFLAGDTALMVPHTADGRVLFAIPWQGRTLLGTTDIPVAEAEAEPQASDAEIDFVLATANRYLARPAVRADIRSLFAGIRPLVGGRGAATAGLARDHCLLLDPDSGLITITGGKWTTYRHMAEDCVDLAARSAGLPRRPCPTADLLIHGGDAADTRSGGFPAYGSDAPALLALIERDPSLGTRLHPRLPALAAEVVWACREEMARTVEDVLSRRTRSLQLDAEAAAAAAPAVARLMAMELGRDEAWERSQIAHFQALAGSSRVA